MTQPLVVQPIAMPSTGQMLKIKDLQEDTNLRNYIDIIGVIAKIGGLKVSTQTSRGSVPAREIYLCDDSWTMVKLIARDFFAESSLHLKSDQIIYIRNVKAMKLRGYTVLATMPDTLLSAEVNTPEAVRLRSWLSQNNLEFKQDGLKDLSFKKFVNLSSLNGSNSPAESGENTNKELQSSQSSESFNQIRLNQSTDSEDNKNIININVTERKRKLCDEDVNVKVIKIDLKPKTTKTNDVEDSSTVSDSATQKFYSNTSEGTTIAKKCETAVISIDSGDEVIEEKRVKKPFKKEILEHEDDDVEAVEAEKDFVVCETFTNLMSVQSPLENWNREKDKYLINFLSKHCTKQLTHDMFLQLLQANLNVFHGLSVDELKSRAEILTSPKNYIYLLQLCGGKKIKTENEKCIFIDRVEQLRRLIKNKEIKEEPTITIVA